MDQEFIIFFALGAAAGGFINGLAGFGTALFTLGFFLQIMPPVQAVAIVLVMSVVSGVQGLWTVRYAMLENPTRLARFLVPALFGIPVGIAALSILDPSVIKLVIAAILILYGGFFSFRRSLPKLVRPTPVIDSMVGFVAGILGGAAALSGALPTMWCSMRPWTKSEARAVFQPFNVVVLSITMGLFAFKGIYSKDTLILVASSLPITILFAQVGIVVFNRLEDDQFRRLLIALMLISGLILVAREIF
jgi:uncharacterized membrane protein YfcA